MLGPKTARRIWQDLGVTTLADLRQAAEQERLRTLSGLGAKIEESVLKALDEAKPTAVDADLLGISDRLATSAVDARDRPPVGPPSGRPSAARCCKPAPP